MKKLLIAGASGYIGRSLIDLALQLGFEVTGLTRFPQSQKSRPGLTWLRADLFSLKDMEAVVGDNEVAIYLVHSMLPSAQLVQGEFYDLDLIISDNFARAVRNSKISHVIYLGGLIPDDKLSLSWHLRSRLEVEKVLATSGKSLTILRAGMIVGNQGSSFNIIWQLVKRLPLMICPKWTQNMTQTLDLRDLMTIFKSLLTSTQLHGKVWDLADSKEWTYFQLLKEVARGLNKNPIMLKVPIFGPRLSQLWVSLITQTPGALVGPLLESLKHSLTARPDHQVPRSFIQYPFDQSVQFYLPLMERPPGAIKSSQESRFWQDVRSVQRLPLPPLKDAIWVAEEYFRWIPSLFFSIIQIHFKETKIVFSLVFSFLPMLILEKDEHRSSADRQLFYIRGGALAGPMRRGRFEFREVMNKRFIVTAIHDFRPALPWFIYKWTQAVIHLWVMKSFGRHLQKIHDQLTPQRDL